MALKSWLWRSKTSSVQVGRREMPFLQIRRMSQEGEPAQVRNQARAHPIPTPERSPRPPREGAPGERGPPREGNRDRDQSSPGEGEAGAPSKGRFAGLPPRGPAAR